MSDFPAGFSGDALVNVVGLIPNTLEVGRVVLVQEELIVFGPVCTCLLYTSDAADE